MPVIYYALWAHVDMIYVQRFLNVITCNLSCHAHPRLRLTDEAHEAFSAFGFRARRLMNVMWQHGNTNFESWL